MDYPLPGEWLDELGKINTFSATDLVRIPLPKVTVWGVSRSPGSDGRVSVMEEVYVVKVRSQPSPARLFPSERRYSASTVGGLGAVHLLLAATCLLLGALDFLAASNTATWVTRYGGGLWLGLAAALPGAAGVLAWRRWVRPDWASERLKNKIDLIGCNKRWPDWSDRARALEPVQSSLQALGNIIGGNPLITSGRDSNHRLSRHRKTRQNKTDAFVFVSSGVGHRIIISSMCFVASSLVTVRPIRLFTLKSAVNCQSAPKKPRGYCTCYHRCCNNVAESELTSDPSKIVSATKAVLFTAWYVDNNIRWFFVSSTVSGFASLLCLALTAAALAVSYESLDNYHQRTFLPDQSVAAAPNPRGVELNPPSHPRYDLPQRQSKDPLAFETTQNIDQASEEGVAFETFHTDVSAKLITSKDSNGSATDEIIENKPMRLRRRAQSDSNDGSKPDKDVNVDDTSQERKSGEKVEFYLRPWSPFDTHTGQDSGEQGPFRGERKETRTMVMINILVASTLELLWSIFSAKIAWKGMKNGYPDEVINHPDRQRKKNRPPVEGDAFPQTKKNKTEPMKDVNGKPDILCNHKRSSSKDKGGRKIRSDVIGESTVSGPNSVQVEGPRLPMEESTMEYQERVRRFLESNQKHSLTLSVRDM
uniref:Uncharacterized protein n=1 Tax=Timema tahoe TaxID=61484 RepID=A0A7R9FH13_9NEOP|nr:unnamed protein product [Timema tahoe]